MTHPRDRFITVFGRKPVLEALRDELDGLEPQSRAEKAAVLAGMIVTRKDGRRNRYSVNLEGPFKHPTISGVTLRTVLGNLSPAASREEVGATAAR